MHDPTNENITYPYLFQEFIEGKGLKEIIGSNERIPFTNEEVTNLLIQALRNADFYHSRNFAVRDIKSGNYRIESTSGDLYNIDTSALLVNPKAGVSRAIIESDIKIPEGICNYDERSDLYLIGVVGIQVYTFNHSIELDEQSGLWLYKDQKNPNHKSLHLETVIDKLTHKEPNERYQNAQEAINDLLGGGKIVVKSESVLKNPAKKVKSNNMIDIQKSVNAVVDIDDYINLYEVIAFSLVEVNLYDSGELKEIKQDYKTSRDDFLSGLEGIIFDNHIGGPRNKRIIEDTHVRPYWLIASAGVAGLSSGVSAIVGASSEIVLAAGIIGGVVGLIFGCTIHLDPPEISMTINQRIELNINNSERFNELVPLFIQYANNLYLKLQDQKEKLVLAKQLNSLKKVFPQHFAECSIESDLEEVRSKIGESQKDFSLE